MRRDVVPPGNRSTSRHPARFAAAILVTAALALAGCSGVAEVTGTATQQDLLQIRTDVTSLQAAVQRTRAELEKQSATLDARSREQATQNQRQLEEIARRLDALSTTLTSLTARVDALGGRLESLSRRSTAVAPAPAPKPAPPTTATPSPPAAPRPAPTPGGIQPQDLYQTAYIDFSKGSYPLAIAGFREFLRRFPEHDLADNAQYWIGEARFSTARSHQNAGQLDKMTEALEQAVQEFKKVIANYPRGDKAPTALYKEALALIELKQPALAQSRLQYLIDNFPQAEETPLARERLGALTGS
ncbi:MAG: outer membrane protein assembly factor BamD [Candidatus Rokubacteria bacterium]|nr:outer membrane protein assembly factor BamD [Candidatus Rokubacteria bacterium]